MLAYINLTDKCNMQCSYCYQKKDEKNIKHNATHLTHPTHLSVTVLPATAKKLISEKFDNYNFKNETTRKSCEYIKNYMMSKDDSNLLAEFKRHTEFLDNKRSEKFKDSYPYFDF